MTVEPQPLSTKPTTHEVSMHFVEIFAKLGGLVAGIAAVFGAYWSLVSTVRVNEATEKQRNEVVEQRFSRLESDLNSAKELRDLVITHGARIERNEADIVELKGLIR